MSTKWKGGYGTPPEAHRFVPGRSGNKKGRPKDRHKERPSDTIMTMLSKEVVVTSADGRRKRVVPIDVILQRLRNKAMNGDTRAIKEILLLLKHIDAERERQAPQGQTIIFRPTGTDIDA